MDDKRGHRRLQRQRGMWSNPVAKKSWSNARGSQRRHGAEYTETLIHGLARSWPLQGRGRGCADRHPTLSKETQAGVADQNRKGQLIRLEQSQQGKLPNS